MPRIAPLDPKRADPASSVLLSAVHARLGGVPNLFATLAHAPAALHGYLQFADALAGGRLTARHRSIVALAVAQANASRYCLSAHSTLGKAAGLNQTEIDQARIGVANERLEAEIAGFARQLVERRGEVGDAEFAALREHGLDDGLILEVIANVALNVLTNYVNHVAGTRVDFPEVSPDGVRAA